MVLKDYKIFQCCINHNFSHQKYNELITSISSLKKNVINLDEFEMEIDMLLSLKRAIYYLSDKQKGLIPEYSAYPVSLAKMWDIRRCVKILKDYPQLHNEKLIDNKMRKLWYLKTKVSLSQQLPDLTPKFIEDFFVLSDLHELREQAVLYKINEEYFILKMDSKAIGLVHKSRLNLYIHYKWLILIDNRREKYKVSLDIDKKRNKMVVNRHKKEVLRLIQES